MNFLNMDEYERGDRWMVFGIPNGPNRQGLLPKMEPEYTFKEIGHDFEPFNLTERTGCYTLMKAVPNILMTAKKMPW